jgi:hypothetical protein
LRFRDSGPIHGRRRDRNRSSSQDDAHQEHRKSREPFFLPAGLGRFRSI